MSDKFLLIFFAILLVSCNNKEVIKIKESKNETPSEWMYNQRAYPNNFINKKAITKGIAQVNTLKKQNRNTSSTNWELKGPINIGGRITDVAISPIDDNHIYVGTAVGGIFESTDRGVTWNPIFDETGKLSIGNIAISQSNPNRIYVGTGEANGGSSDAANFGDGVYRSDDAGATWQHIGLNESNHIGRVIVDPNNPDRVFVAATGVQYGKSIERGVYRTTNGGTNWDKVLYVSDSTSIIDVAMNPANTNILFAAAWERIRYPYVRDYGGKSSGVYRSLDGGDTWSKLANGLPTSNDDTGRIGIAISPSNPSIIYASYTTDLIQNVFNGLYKSTDNGDNWSLVALSDISDVNATFGWYFGNVRVHPNNENEVYVLGQKLYKTSNSGTSWNEVYGMHVDYHAMEYSKTNPNFMVAGCDGGVYLSENGGASWNHINNLPITQIYNLEVDYQLPERLYCGTQDNNTLTTSTGSLDDWYAILGGDGFQVNVDKTNSGTIYCEYQWGNLYRIDDVYGGPNWALNGVDYADRNNWNTPVEISPIDSNVLFYGSNKLYKSTNRAEYWNAISPDLTNGEHPSGSQSFGTLTCIAPSYNDIDVIYVGSDDGNLSVTFDGGANWASIDNGMPNRYVTQISINPNDNLTAYVTYSGYGYLDYAAHIFKTVDGGQNWMDISGNLPSIPINDVVYAPDGKLYIATDLGVWYANDDNGTDWNILGNNLPTTIVADIKIHEPTNILYAGTFGRSMYSYNLNTSATINDFSIVNSIKIYPNPINANSIVEFNLEQSNNTSIYITDLLGKKIALIQHTKLESGLHKINISNNNTLKGMYFLHIQTANKHLSKKVIFN